MSYSTILILTGMFVEIVAGLVLAIDAIGLPRIDNWVSAISLTRDVFTKKGPLGLKGVKLVVVCAIVLISFAAGGFAAFHLTPFLSLRTGKWLTDGGIAFLVGITTMFLTQYVLQIGMLGIAAALRAAEQSAERKVSGIVGACLLVCGFVLQFVGTTLQAM